MSNYRTAMGKSVDMAALAARNEKTRAVGNMGVNARGDSIDSQGRIIKPATAKVNEQYAKTVQHQQRTANKVQQPVATKTIPKEELSKHEIDLDRELDDDEVVEQIKAMEMEQLKKGKK
jgi:hypothetical protein